MFTWAIPAHPALATTHSAYDMRDTYAAHVICHPTNLEPN